jgi:DNA-binding NarL/FixJ family response regulator
VAQQNSAQQSGFDPENPYALTLVEQQVVDLLISGLTGEEVGELLRVDRREVALRRASAMRKYGARNGMHLAHLIEITRRAAPAGDSDVIVLEDIPTSIGF